MVCPVADNTDITDNSPFWANGFHWDRHRIGWVVSGGCAALTLIISTISVLLHCRNYTKRAEQRQIIRILYMPPIFATISFLSYRFYRDYTYYSLVNIAYEAVTLSAFLLLLIEYVASTATGHDPLKAIDRKDKTALPIPFCCFRYRPTKAYFMHTVKWAVLQYVIVRPLVSIAGIVCEKFDILCNSTEFNFHYAKIYLEIIDFFSISTALYGLVLFYGLTKDELKGRRPLAKFLCIKLIVMATFYQSFVFHALEGRVIKGTQYWTATNIANGLNALVLCIEMIFFSLAMLWAYGSRDYVIKGSPKTSIWRPLWDSVNYTDFALEIFGSLKFYFSRRSAPTSYSLGSTEAATMRQQPAPSGRMSFGQAFSVGGQYQRAQSGDDGAPSDQSPTDGYSSTVKYRRESWSPPPDERYMGIAK